MKYIESIFLIISSKNIIYNFLKNIWYYHIKIFEKKYGKNNDKIKFIFLENDEELSEDIKYNEENYTFYVKEKESIEPGVLIKTVKGMEYCLSNFNFKYLYRTNLSSLFNFDNYFKFINNLSDNTEKYIGGNIFRWNTTFISGAGIFMTKKIVEDILKNKNKLNYERADDVALSVLVSDLGIEFSDIYMNFYKNYQLFINSWKDTMHYRIKIMLDNEKRLEKEYKIYDNILNFIYKDTINYKINNDDIDLVLYGNEEVLFFNVTDIIKEKIKKNNMILINYYLFNINNDILKDKKDINFLLIKIKDKIYKFTENEIIDDDFINNKSKVFFDYEFFNNFIPKKHIFDYVIYGNDNGWINLTDKLNNLYMNDKIIYLNKKYLELDKYDDDNDDNDADKKYILYFGGALFKFKENMVFINNGQINISKYLLNQNISLLKLFKNGKFIEKAYYHKFFNKVNITKVLNEKLLNNEEIIFNHEKLNIEDPWTLVKKEVEIIKNNILYKYEENDIY